MSEEGSSFSCCNSTSQNNKICKDFAVQTGLFANIVRNIAQGQSESDVSTQGANFKFFGTGSSQVIGIFDPDTSNYYELSVKIINGNPTLYVKETPLS